MNNPGLELRQFIEDRKNDSGEDWEYIYTPQIENIINELDEKQTEEFCKEIWSWPELNLYELADPILATSNKYFDGFQVYMKIFSKISDLEKLEYLAENAGRNWKERLISEWAIEDLSNILKNFKRVDELIKNEEYSDQYKSIERTIESVIQAKTEK